MTILSTLPSAGVGALLALLVSGQDLGIIAIIGIILLIGIVKKNAIMMIDFALEAEREGGMAPRDAIFQACLLRFRPILMTTMAALLGALPLMLGTGIGAELRQPLGVTMVGGLLVSQVLTLFTTPVIYLAFDSVAMRLKGWRKRRFGDPDDGGDGGDDEDAHRPPPEPESEREPAGAARLMNLSAAFIQRPVATALLTIGILLAGLAAFRLLPVSPLPQVDFPTISVSASLPGASPETMAATVATPLERALGTIAGVTEITSSSSLGSTRVTLQFDLSRDIDGAARDVQAAINAARGTLPTSLPNNPTYRKVNPADAPIMIIGLTSPTMTRGQLYDAASTILSQKLSQVEGVGQVTIGGASLPAVRVELNPTALNKYGISLEDVRNTISATNANRPLGVLENNVNNWQVYANDQAMTAKDYMPLIVRYATPGTYSSASAGALIASTANATAGGGVSTKTVNGITTTTITTSSGTTTVSSAPRAATAPPPAPTPSRCRSGSRTWPAWWIRCRTSAMPARPTASRRCCWCSTARPAPTSSRPWTASTRCCRQLREMIPASISMDVDDGAHAHHPRLAARGRAHADDLGGAGDPGGVPVPAQRAAPR